MNTLILIPSGLEARHLIGDVAWEPGPIPTWTQGSTTWALCGIGAAAAAFSTGLLLAQRRPDRVVLVGIAGAFPGSGLAINALVQAQSDLFADLGHRDAAGFHTLDTLNLPVLLYGGRVLGCSYPFSVLDETTASGPMITRATVTTEPDTAETLVRQFGAVAESMEGAGVAMAAAALGVPCSQVRAISNWVGPRDPKSWSIAPALGQLREWLARVLNV